jgi:hypothetical protein
VTRVQNTSGPDSWQPGGMSKAVQRRTDRASMDIEATLDALYSAFADAERLMIWLPPGTMTGRALEYDHRASARRITTRGSARRSRTSRRS